ncbi:MAG TPA: DUF4262 domain-containing protein [Chloroflexota bacterium]
MSVYSKIRARVEDDIRRTGWHVTGVFPSEDGGVPTYFVYTAGLWGTLQHPELIVFGLRPEVAHGIFSGVRERILKGERFEDGQFADRVVRNYRVYFHRVRNDDDMYPTTSATAYYGHRDYEVLQIVLPDMQDRFPWDPACDEKMRLTQQLLGAIKEP